MVNGSGSPEQRIVEKVARVGDVGAHEQILLTIPSLYAGGLFVWYVLPIRMAVAMIGTSLLAAAVLVEALFLNPPIP